MIRLTLREIAARRGVSYEAMRRRRKKENWKSAGMAKLKFNKTEVFRLDDLPFDIQSLFTQKGGNPASDGNEAYGCIPPAVASGTANSFTARGREARPLLTALTFSRVKPIDKTITPSSAVPEKGMLIALARIDLVKAWQDYRRRHSKTTEADKEFLTAYNNGLLYRKLYAVLGDIKSINTFRGWEKLLGFSSDWTVLVPLHFFRDGGGTLSQEEKDVVLRMVLTPFKLRTGTAIRFTKTYLRNIGRPSAKSDRTFRRFVEEFKAKHSDLWIFIREGQKALRDKVEPFIRRDPSLLEVGQVLVADGHRLNFEVINPFSGKPCRATMVAYLDWKSYDLAGYEIMVEENTQCIASALRNSIIRMGKTPEIVYQDNGKAFRARFFTSLESFDSCGFYGLFGRLNITPVFAHPYNARAKIIERWFREFSDTCERLIPSFVGSCIEDKPAWLLRNEPFHKAIKSGYIPTIEEAMQHIDAWHEWHRRQPCPHVAGKTIGEVFDAGKGPGVNIEELDDLMMAMKITRISRAGIRFLNAEYYSDELYGLREGAVIRYSLSDLSAITVYDLRNNFLCRAERRMPAHPMAQHFGDAKDQEQLKALLAQQKRLERRTIEAAKEFLGAGTPVELPWQKAISIAPKTIEKLERENIELPAICESIPSEAIRPDTQDRDRAEGAGDRQNTDRPGARAPLFESMIERYDYHLENGFVTEEDLSFKERFEQTEDYRMTFGFFDEQRRKAAQG